MSTGPSASRRRRSTTTSSCNGTEPPTRPVFPPWGTTATHASLHSRNTAATSSTVPGRTTAGVEPQNRPVQSTTWAATTSASVRTCASPTAARSPRTSSDAETIDRSLRARHAKIMVVDECTESLRGRLLVATPPLVDPNFDRTVVLMLEHGPDGALGLVLNRPSDTVLHDVVPEWTALATSDAIRSISVSP